MRRRHGRKIAEWVIIKRVIRSRPRQPSAHLLVLWSPLLPTTQGALARHPKEWGMSEMWVKTSVCVNIWRCCWWWKERMCWWWGAASPSALLPPLVGCFWSFSCWNHFPACMQTHHSYVPVLTHTHARAHTHTHVTWVPLFWFGAEIKPGSVTLLC